MARIPIDFKDLYTATGATMEERSLPIRVAILVDTTASDTLIEIVKKAFIPQSPTAFLHIESYGVTVPRVDGAADLVIIIAGQSPLTGDLADSCQRQGLEVVVLSDDLAELIALAEAGLHPLSPLGLLAYDCNVEDDKDSEKEFLNKLGNWIVDHCKDKRLAFAAAFEFVRRPLALEISKATAFQNAAIGALLIIPGADMPVMTLNQVKMIFQIAAAYGENVGIERAKEIAVVIASGFAFRTAARQLVGVIPALGWAIKAGIGYSGTIAMGLAAVEYFENGGNIEGVAEKVIAAREKAVKAAGEVSSRRGAIKAKRRRDREQIMADAVEVNDIVIEPLALGVEEPRDN